MKNWGRRFGCLWNKPYQSLHRIGVIRTPQEWEVKINDVTTKVKPIWEAINWKLSYTNQLTSKYVPN